MTCFQRCGLFHNAESALKAWDGYPQVRGGTIRRMDPKTEEECWEAFWAVIARAHCDAVLRAAAEKAREARR